ncbi:MAG: sialate O-acetylesterase [Bacteroidales bacterium]|nr:sialate O-acetylesterase [Bacteroidales bacterium]
MKRYFALAVLLTAWAFFLPAQDKKPSEDSAFRVSSMFSDHMVIQRDTLAPVWGLAAPGTKVTVSPSWGKKKYSCTADGSGRWKVFVETPEAGGPYSLTVASKGDKVVFQDVMSGEVWFCSGQSNMALQVKGSSSQPVVGGVEAILEAPEYADRIRLYNIGNEREFEPVENIDCRWTLSDSRAAADFSAVGYFFAKYLTKALGVPVGMICGAWGGCNLETWMPMEYIDKAVKGKIPEDKYRAIVDRKEDYKLPPLQVGTMYNARLFPVKGYAVKGFLWYQGTSNMYEYAAYDKLQTELAQCWRDSWDDKDNKLPFYFCSLAPFAYQDPANQARGYFVEAQLRTLDMIPNSGAAITETLGDSCCIHPAKKPQVARQLALLALERDYDVDNGLGSSFPYPARVTFPAGSSVVEKEIRQSGFPVKICKSDKQEGKIVINLANASSGVGAYSNQLEETYIEVRGFEVASPDRVFRPVKANAGHSVITLDCSGIDDPVAVRYGFRCYIDADVVTCYGTPLPPFRTDDWPQNQ